MTLPYSDAIFIQAFPRECTETFQEGNCRAFEFFGEVPVRISYDNSKVAVVKMTGNRERAVTAEFQRLQSHFLFEEHFCLVRRPNTKGHVERLLDYTGRKFLVPLPRVRLLPELNQQLVSHCERNLERTLGGGKPAAKQVLLAEERYQFRPLPEETFEARRNVQTQADSCRHWIWGVCTGRACA